MATNYFDTERAIREYVSKWEAQGYPEGIPDEAPIELERALKVPSYRMICRALLKNDFLLKSLGFTRPTCELYMQLKKTELIERGVLTIHTTQGLFGEEHECI